jgi:ribosomal-protein-alanine acetyltransferase
MSHERQISTSNEIRTQRALSLVRTATLHDIPAILQVEQSCATAAHWSAEQYRRAIERVDNAPERLVLVAESEDRLHRKVKTPTLPQKRRPGWGNQQGQGTPVGFLVTRLVEREWELENLVVSPACRGQGVGSRLLDALFERVRATNGKAIFLEVRESNGAARRLYERGGFRESGRRRRYYSDPVEDAVLYCKTVV